VSARRRLKQIADVVVSNVDKKSLDGERSVHLCNYTDVYYNERITRDLPFMQATATTGQVARFSLRAGDVLITKDSETADDIAVPAYVTEDMPDVLCGYHLAVARPRQQTDGQYLFWALASSSCRGRFSASATGVTRFGLRYEVFGDVLVPLPPLPVQRTIADYLDIETARIDSLIEKKRRLVELLTGERMTVIVDGVSGRLSARNVESSSLPWLPVRGIGWREAKLTLVAELGSGHTPSREHPEWWSDCTIPWITTGEVTQMRSDKIEYITETREAISAVGLANSAAELRPAGTVVLCRTASAGYSAIMGCAMATSQDFATWTCGPLLRPRFLLLCLRAMRQDLLGRLAMGSTHKTIYMPDIQALRVPLPLVDEQDTIVEQVWDRLERIDRIADAVERQLGLLRERRQALITAAVTGELDIPGFPA
jgi:type I restriction enzyme S subunit